MTHSPRNTYADQTDAAPRLTTTQARSGVRRGIYRILAISTLLAVIVLGLVWVGVGGHSHSASPQTHPNGQPVAAGS